MSSETYEVPIFPLHTVLFPGGFLPLKLFETRYVDMMKICLKEDSPFGVCLIREGREVGAPATHESIGCLATITQWEMPHLGLFTIEATGTRTFQIVNKSIAPSNLIKATIMCKPSEPEIVPGPEHQACIEILRKLIAQIGPKNFHSPLKFASLNWVVYRLAELIPVEAQVRQDFLEINTATKRAERMLSILASLGTTTS